VDKYLTPTMDVDKLWGNIYDNVWWGNIL
jgi:hypothetical protein